MIKHKKSAPSRAGGLEAASMEAAVERNRRLLVQTNAVTRQLQGGTWIMHALRAAPVLHEVVSANVRRDVAKLSDGTTRGRPTGLNERLQHCDGLSNEDGSMKFTNKVLAVIAGLALTMGVAQAGKYSDTESLFRNAGESANFFKKSYAYAVFPTVGEAGFIVGGALGKGRVYVHGRLVGNTTMTQGSVGFQAGGKAYSQIIFFENKEALEEFESGSFEFSAGASAVAITASAQASASTEGSSAGASGYEKAATNIGAYYKGMAVFTIAKGGLMYAATVAGQHFSYSPRGAG